MISPETNNLIAQKVDHNRKLAIATAVTLAPVLLADWILQPLPDETYYQVQKQISFFLSSASIHPDPNFYRWHMGNMFAIIGNSYVISTLLDARRIKKENLPFEEHLSKERLTRIIAASFLYLLSVAHEFLQVELENKPLDTADIKAYSAGLAIVILIALSEQVARKRTKSEKKEK